MSRQTELRGKRSVSVKEASLAFCKLELEHGRRLIRFSSEGKRASFLFELNMDFQVVFQMGVQTKLAELAAFPLLSLTLRHSGAVSLLLERFS